MTGFFRRLADRAQGTAPLLAPRLPSLFEPEAWAAGIDEIGQNSAAAPASTSPSAGPPVAGRATDAAAEPARSAGLAVPASMPRAPPPTATASMILPAPARRGLPPNGASPGNASIGGAATGPRHNPMAAEAAEPTHAARADGADYRVAPVAAARASPGVARRTETPAASPPPPAHAADVPAMHRGVAPPTPPVDVATPGNATAPPRRERPSRPTAMSPAGVASVATSAAATPSTAAGPPSSPHATPPAIEIAIGRVEIRFAPPVAPATPAARQVGPPPLAELLARRRGDAR